MNKFTGVIISLGSIEVISDKFKKREVVIENRSGTNPNPVLFQAANETADILDKFKAGDSIEVSYYVNGNTWDDDGEIKYINNLNIANIYKVEREKMTAETASKSTEE